MVTLRSGTTPSKATPPAKAIKRSTSKSPARRASKSPARASKSTPIAKNIKVRAWHA